MTLPKYKAVKLDIIYRMKCGEFKELMKLPSENHLADEYQVSRVTIRKSLDELEREDYITRKQGKGTFILRTPHPNQEEDAVEGLTAIIKKQGFDATVEMLAKEVQSTDESTAMSMNMNPGDPVLVYKRVYKADGVPVIYAESRINYKMLPGIEEYDFGFISYLEVFENFYNNKMFVLQQAVSAKHSNHIAECLEMDKDIPFMQVNYLLQGEQQKSYWPIESVSLCARTDIEGFKLHLGSYSI